MRQNRTYNDAAMFVDTFGQPTASFPYEVNPSPVRDPLTGSFAAGIEVKTYLFLDENTPQLLATDFHLEPMGDEPTIEWASDHQEALERSVFLAATQIERLNTCQKM